MSQLKFQLLSPIKKDWSELVFSKKKRFNSLLIFILQQSQLSSAHPSVSGEARFSCNRQKRRSCVISCTSVVCLTLSVILLMPLVFSPACSHPHLPVPWNIQSQPGCSCPLARLLLLELARNQAILYSTHILRMDVWTLFMKALFKF